MPVPTTGSDESTSHTIEHNGGRLAYHVRGDGPPVLFIQGVGVHGDGWRPQIDVLSARFRCLSFDNRGMGRSLPVPASVTVEQLADDARAIVDAEKLRLRSPGACAGWE